MWGWGLCCGEIGALRASGAAPAALPSIVHGYREGLAVETMVLVGALVTSIGYHVARTMSARVLGLTPVQWRVADIYVAHVMFVLMAIHLHGLARGLRRLLLAVLPGAIGVAFAVIGISPIFLLTVVMPAVGSVAVRAAMSGGLAGMGVDAAAFRRAMAPSVVSGAALALSGIFPQHYDVWHSLWHCAAGLASYRIFVARRVPKRSGRSSP